MLPEFGFTGHTGLQIQESSKCHRKEQDFGGLAHPSAPGFRSSSQRSSHPKTERFLLRDSNPRRMSRVDFHREEKKMLEGMSKLVTEYLQRRASYAALVTFVLYFGLYLSILYLQKNADAGYSIESTIR